jgi:hypothetical protein
MMEVQMGSVAKSYMRKGLLTYDEMLKYLFRYEEGFLIYEEMLKYLTIYEEGLPNI